MFKCFYNCNVILLEGNFHAYGSPASVVSLVFENNSMMILDAGQRNLYGLGPFASSCWHIGKQKHCAIFVFFSLLELATIIMFKVAEV